MRPLLISTLLLALTACSSPCDICDEQAALWDACHETWADDYNLELSCQEGISADWYDGEGNLTDEGLEAWNESLVPCESARQVRASCRDQVSAKETAYDDVDEYYAECEAEPEALTTARVEQDCAGWLEALGVI